MRREREREREREKARKKKGGWRLLSVICLLSSPRTMDGSCLDHWASWRERKKERETDRERSRGFCYSSPAIICFIPHSFPCSHVGVGNDYRPMDGWMDGRADSRHEALFEKHGMGMGQPKQSLLSVLSPLCCNLQCSRTIYGHISLFLNHTYPIAILPKPKWEY